MLLRAELEKIKARRNSAGEADDEKRPPIGFHKICRLLIVDKKWPIKHLNVDSFADFLKLLVDMNKFFGRYHRFLEDETCRYEFHLVHEY